jgi:pSer/pThr/pTyr-binding forkhead associated (FHA) protein
LALFRKGWFGFRTRLWSLRNDLLSFRKSQGVFRIKRVRFRNRGVELRMRTNGSLDNKSRGIRYHSFLLQFTWLVAYAAHMAQLKVISPEGTEHLLQLQTKHAMIGRGPNCEVRLPVRSVSLHHAKLDLSGSEPYLVDLGSTNGVRLNQEQVPSNGRVALQHNDTIEVGTYRLIFVGVEDTAEAESPDTLAHLLAQDALSQEDKRPSLSVLNGPQAGLRVFFQEPLRQIIIGRGEECELRLVDAGASRRHAQLRCSLDGARLSDLGSRHGTTVNGVLILPNQSTPLKDHSEIMIGQTKISYSDPEEALFSSLAPESERAEKPKEEKPPAPDQAPVMGKVAPSVVMVQRWAKREQILLGGAVLFLVLFLGLCWEAFN